MFLVFWGCSGFSGECSLFSGGVPGFLGGVSGFLGGVPGFLGVFRVFWGVFLVFLGGVPGFLGVFRVFWRVVPGFRWCSGFFGCSGVPVFLEVLHAKGNGLDLGAEPTHINIC